MAKDSNARFEKFFRFEQKPDRKARSRENIDQVEVMAVGSRKLIVRIRIECRKFSVLLIKH